MGAIPNKASLSFLFFSLLFLLSLSFPSFSLSLLFPFLPFSFFSSFSLLFLFLSFSLIHFPLASRFLSSPFYLTPSPLTDPFSTWSFFIFHFCMRADQEKTFLQSSAQAIFRSFSFLLCFAQGNSLLLFILYAEFIWGKNLCLNVYLFNKNVSKWRNFNLKLSLPAQNLQAGGLNFWKKKQSSAIWTGLVAVFF